MYGLVHQGLKDLIITDYGPDMWAQVKRSSGLSDSEFISMESYPDAETFKIVTAAIEELHIPVEKLLEDFGVHWVKYSAEGAYHELFAMAGKSLPEFLKNLDMLHVRVASIMPNLVPPSFECVNETSKSIQVYYRSQRQGLAPMVVGLIKGLGLRFGTPCEVSILENPTEDKNTTVFNVAWDN